jgi:hypothetical protein
VVDLRDGMVTATHGASGSGRTTAGMPQRAEARRLRPRGDLSSPHRYRQEEILRKEARECNGVAISLVMDSGTDQTRRGAGRACRR